MEAREIQNMVSDENTAPQEEPFSVVVDQLATVDLRQGQSPMRRGEEGGRRAVEPVMIQVVVSDTGDPDSNEVNRSTAAEQSPVASDRKSAFQATAAEQSPVASDRKSAFQATAAWALVGGSLCFILAVPGGVNGAGRAVMGDTIAFSVFLVADMVALLTSLVVGMILATVSHISAKMDYFMRTSLWTASVCLVLTFHAAAYVVVLPSHKWIVLCFGGAVAMALALLLFSQLPMMFYQVSMTSPIGDGGMRFSNGFEGGHFSRDSRGG